MKKHIVFLFVTIIISASCSDKTPPVDVIKVENTEQIAKMNQFFGWNIFQKEIESKPGENVLISPLSIQTALSMALNGAGSNTLEQMLQVLDCKNCEVNSINNRLQELTSLLTTQSGHAAISITNAFFYDQNRINVNETFKNKLEQAYECGFQNENFDQAETAITNINAWVKNQTNGKIDQIISEITPDDIAFLINALHFKADWSKGFNTDLTRPGNFLTSSGNQIETSFIGDYRHVPSFVDKDYIIADIPFKDSTFSFSIITTTTKSTKNITSFSQSDYDTLTDKLSIHNASLTMPKLKLSYKNELNKSLDALGMKDAFNPLLADFKSMATSTDNIAIGKINHKAILEVDEKGAEGAAVTSIGFTTTEAQDYLLLNFNKPSVIVIRHIESSALLFIAYVANPGK
ncbi:MAG: hypothetical protein IPO92_09115 [Saprospiraceae bacterium]|nr:hypothetical protein [Saprospiraceae bacterium]